ncbi:lipopolysaccharide kinase InaA family protein [Sulfurimonas sp.]|uniref:lipopolysaccharide kinase InaA family protein n=1 Tax=Sulfurimonas sp. TaxID=2022749 RepID=UPI0025EA1B5C|nr:lipopolysaccharide kinase InaA family protein [Sulfurimonas sp.]MBT5935569.1 hypothetical protein [Sulfurimonas sp.]
MSYKLQINKKYKNFEHELINIQKIFTTADETIHKARNELKIIEINGLKCVVKSFKIPHLINRVAYTYFRDGKAKKSFNNAQKLSELNVNTPEPIGIIEFFNFGLLNKSYFISLYEPYNFTIREVFHHKVEDTQEILKQFTRFTYELHKKGVWHVDYSLGNILITNTNDTFKFSLVDINRMQFKEISASEGLKNFNKFWVKEKNDLVIIAKEYASLSSFDESTAIQIIQSEAQKLEKKVNLKRRIKANI